MTAAPFPAAHAPLADAGSTGAGLTSQALAAGRTKDPRWVRPAMLGMLTLTALLDIVGLGRSGWANSFYSAAVQAGSVSWKAFLFGSSDAANSITVDKPPAFLWPMEISARIFGLSSWSMLLPNALEGIASVWLLYAAVRRVAGPVAGLIAGGVLALTPVAVLMFRFNNPEALMTLLFTLAAYATIRAIEHGRLRWLVIAGVAVGGAFLTKTLEALVVLPALAIVFLIAAPLPFWRRIGHLLWAGLAMVVSGGWWVALVSAWPASDRPYIGGSQDNSELNLILGYNGIGRLTGNETGSVGGGAPAGGAGAFGGFGGGRGGGAFGGSTGLTRLWGSDMGTQIAWLLAAALILLVGGFWLTRRASRTDLTRAAFGVFGGWLLVTGAVFSFSRGIIHPYYTVALAPAIGALVGMGAVSAWRSRDRISGRVLLAAAGAATAVTAWDLLGRTPTFLPWLRSVVLVLGLVGAAAVLLAEVVRRLPAGRAAGAVAAVGGAVAVVLASLGAPAAFAQQTASVGHTGSLPTAGPAATGGFGRAFGGRGGGGFGFGRRGGTPNGGGGTGGPPGGGFSFGGPGGTGGFPGGTGGFPGGTGGFPGGGAGRTGAGGGMGGLLDASTPSAALTAVVGKDASRYTWVAAAIGSQTAAGYQLATRDPVMAIGGFNGSDPSPTLAQFQQLVAAGRIHYFIGGGGFGRQNGGSNYSAEISSWVAAHFTASTVGGITLYDLTASSTSTAASAFDSGAATI